MIVRVICEAPTCEETFYCRVTSSKFAKQAAEDIFFDWANFSFGFVDKSEVPSDAEIMEY